MLPGLYVLRFVFVVIWIVSVLWLVDFVFGFAFVCGLWCTVERVLCWITMCGRGWAPSCAC